MKKKFSAILAMIMVFTMVAPYAVAVEQSDEEEMQTITRGYAVYYEDENGNLVIEEEGSFSEEVPVPNPNSRLLTQEYTNLKSFTGATLIMKSRFEYEAGYSVKVYSNNAYTTVDPSWTLVSDNVAGRTAANDSWVRLTYTAKIRRNSDHLERTHSIWTECTRSGVITKG